MRRNPTVLGAQTWYLILSSMFRHGAVEQPSAGLSSYALPIEKRKVDGSDERSTLYKQKSIPLRNTFPFCVVLATGDTTL